MCVRIRELTPAVFVCVILKENQEMEQEAQNIENNFDQLVAHLNKIAEVHAADAAAEQERKRRRVTKEAGVQTEEQPKEDDNGDKMKMRKETRGEKRVEQLEARISIGEKKQTQLAQQLADMAQLLREAQDREQRLQQRCAMVHACEERIHELEAKAQSLAQLRETTLGEFSGLQKQVTLLSMHHTALEAARDDAQHEIEALRQELDTAGHRHEELVRQCAQLEKELAEKSGAVSRLESAVEHNRAENEQFAGEAQRLREALAETEERNRTNLRHIEELTRHMKTHFTEKERVNDGKPQEEDKGGETVAVSERGASTEEQDCACAGSC